MAAKSGVEAVRGVLGKQAAEEVQGWLAGDFLHGLLAVARSLLDVLSNGRRGPHGKAVAKASRRVVGVAVNTSVALFVTFGIFWVAVSFLLWLVTSLLYISGNSWLLHSIPSSVPFVRVLRLLSVVVSQLVVLFIQYWAFGDLDVVFVAALRSVKPSSAAHGQQIEQLAAALEELPPEDSLRWLRRYSFSVVSGWGLALGVLLLSFLPLVGRFVVPCALLFKRHRAVGLVPAAVLLVVSFLPAGRYLASLGLQLVLTARSAWKELLYPYIGRASKSQRNALGARHLARLSGFGAAAAVVLSVPVLGPLFWFDLVALAAEQFAEVLQTDGGGNFGLQKALEAYRAEEARREAEAERRMRERAADAKSALGGR